MSEINLSYLYSKHLSRTPPGTVSINIYIYEQIPLGLVCICITV